ncbi:MAG: T9SS type A sorting domain-containing protein, partial [Bacteroidota bacterium]
QIVISSRNLSEIWIIDHSTTTAEAASHSGGVYAKGGDLLYRWGNPQAYNRGNPADKKLFGQHNPRWIENGFPDAGNIMIFNNGFNRPQGNFSSVDIIAPPIDVSGNYLINAGQPFQPDSAYWKYMAPVPTDFFSNIISGAQRLSNGNTIICEGVKGNFFEIDTAENIVWQYVSPVDQNGIITQGNTPGMNSVFRCTLYEPSYPGFTGLVLTPGNPIELNPLSYNCMMLSGIQESFDEISSVKIVSPFGNKIILFANDALKNVSIKLSDISGRTIQSLNDISLTKNQRFEIAVDKNLSEGIYFLQITNSKINFTTKLIRHL